MQTKKIEKKNAAAANQPTNPDAKTTNFLRLNVESGNEPINQNPIRIKCL